MALRKQQSDRQSTRLRKLFHFRPTGHSSTSVKANTEPAKKGKGRVSLILKFFSGMLNRLCNQHAKKVVNWPKANKPGIQERVAESLSLAVTSAHQFLNDNEGLNTMNEDWMFSALYANVESGGAERKAATVLVPHAHEDASEPVYWDNIPANGELKLSSTFSLSDLDGYTCLCFGRHRARRFVLGFGILDTDIDFRKFDGAGVVVSRISGTHRNARDFLRIILDLVVGDEYHLDPGPPFICKQNKEKAMLEDKRYKIKETSQSDQVIYGRRTVVLLMEDNEDELLVMKDRWVNSTQKVKDCALLDFVGSVKGVRGERGAARLVDYLFVQARAGDEAVYGSIKENKRHGNKGIETRHNRGPHGYVRRHGKELRDFKLLKVLVSVFQDRMQDLHNKLVHRDISPHSSNLVEKGDSLRRDFRIDFDSSIMKTRQTPATAARTGSMPFMAIEILKDENQKHDFYHDMESLFYVLMWTCVTQNGPSNKPRPVSEFNFKNSALYRWCGAKNGKELTMEQIGVYKHTMMRDMSDFEEQIISCLPKYFEPVTNLLHDLRDIVFRISKRRSRRAARKKDNRENQQRLDDWEESRKREKMQTILSLLRRASDELPADEKPSAIIDSQLKDVSRPIRTDGNMELQIECIKDRICELMRQTKVIVSEHPL